MRSFTAPFRGFTVVTSKEELQAKIGRVHAARMKVEVFVAAGGDLKSAEAAPIGVELTRSYDDLCKEFGQPRSLMMVTSKEELQAKIGRVHAARMKVEVFVAAGGDLKSAEAVPIGVELTRSYDDLCKEFGQQVLDEMKLK
jgi:hypothetical protein